MVFVFSGQPYERTGSDIRLVFAIDTGATSRLLSGGDKRDRILTIYQNQK